MDIYHTPSQESPVSLKGHTRATNKKVKDRLYYLDCKKNVTFELGFKRRKSLSMADGKGKTVPGDRANVRKGALSLELVASVSNSESSSVIVIDR